MTTEVSAGPHHHIWYVGCKDCDARPDVSGHYVTLRTDDWAMEHSIECRMSGDMQSPDGCRWQQHFLTFSKETVQERYPLGRYRMKSAWGDLLLERADSE